MTCKVPADSGNDAIEKVKDAVLVEMNWAIDGALAEDEVRKLLRVVGVRR
jgi:hypothetical protein